MEDKKIKNNNYEKNSKGEQVIAALSNEIREGNNKIIPSYASFFKSLGSIIESLKPTINLASKRACQIVNAISPIQETIQSLIKSLIPIINQVANSIPDISSYFGELANTIKELQKNPDNIFNWIEFSKSLSNYFWLPPYLMESSQLMKLLKTVECEQQMDEELEKYFTEQIINELLDEIINKSFSKHEEIMIQIKKAYNNKSYALVNTGLFSVIDSLCSFFVLNKKKNTYRINLFEPILRVEERESDDYYAILILSMVNDNINFLYSKNNCSHKIARRHPSQHGEFFSNNKIDTIMLLHTTYYLLIMTDVYKKYKKSLKLEIRRVEKKKILKYKLVK